MTLRDSIAQIIKGDAVDDGETRLKYSRDTSIFERTPQVVVFPKDADDVSAVVTFTHEEKSAGREVSVTGRSAGSDMTGGDLTDSISMVFMKYMNHIIEITRDFAVAEPGVFYRDLEKETLEKTGKIIASYPASRNLCAIGGMVANNSGGELTLRYGKTNRYVEELEVVLSDGTKTTVRALSPEELAVKEKEDSFEGNIYRDVHALITEHAEEIKTARPNVTKNSAGYPLWDVVDEKTGTFDLNQLIAGSQGTLALVTKAKIRLVKTKGHRSMLVVFLTDLGILPDIVHRVLKFGPESFESYDDQTMKLAVRFIPQIIGHFGIVQMIQLGFAFIPEMWMALTGGVPKLIVMAEFAEDTAEEALEKAKAAAASLDGLAVKTKIARSETQAAKYWTIRRESFSLLRKNLRGLHAASFIDDLVVHPDDYPRFIPELNTIMQEHHLIYTIAGHIGDANFHIIPLMNLADPAARREIMVLTPKVYKLVAKYKGSITGEHNDGIIRTPFLPIMYSEKMIELFAQIKKIFDPLGVLNPGKKVGGTIADIERSMIKGK
ncbi:MAG: Oxidoreductase [Candidatus Kaiserbacteria bacterium GW2011_GWB1_52_6]|uniref:D-lactate dehydrogenase (cytochrome) n=3 Tax=Candidatus Kaiseribacteriota TaxID=1752734 RepID=A0A0G1XGF1_9BACT|nr:MAG: Oxidoreductase [Candidatus Kaiserbacteria bacterium GW2011_GWA2_52_12]KKW27011.1 MAG: Oxidoreductase [Candidatus Kaiserbacteria bacterium GW2011_GWB1_52_6]KKW30333.1 MAG: Oxidoreductase [Candidatus Kaiserbacteria bacterium GW2011_GWC2_52_8b]